MLKLTFKKQNGVGLIEVLIAVVILAVGLLGFAGLQTQALRTNYESLQRARASSLAEDILDRMRANQFHAIENDDYEREFGDDVGDAGTDCSSESCTPTQMAEWDMDEWFNNRLRVIIPTADARITKNPQGLPVTPADDSANRIYRVEIRLVEVTEMQNNAGAQAAVINDDAEDQLVIFQYESYL